MGMLFYFGLFLPCMLLCNLLPGVQGVGEVKGGEQKQCGSSRPMKSPNMADMEWLEQEKESKTLCS